MCMCEKIYWPWANSMQRTLQAASIYLMSEDLRLWTEKFSPCALNK
jgi:hypothetical protein